MTSLVDEKYHPYIEGLVDGREFRYIVGMEYPSTMAEELAEALHWAGADDEAVARLRRFFIARDATLREHSDSRIQRRRKTWKERLLP